MPAPAGGTGRVRRGGLAGVTGPAVDGGRTGTGRPRGAHSPRRPGTVRAGRRGLTGRSAGRFPAAWRRPSIDGPDRIAPGRPRRRGGRPGVRNGGAGGPFAALGRPVRDVTGTSSSWCRFGRSGHPRRPAPSCSRRSGSSPCRCRFRSSWCGRSGACRSRAPVDELGPGDARVIRAVDDPEVQRFEGRGLPNSDLQVAFLQRRVDPDVVGRALRMGGLRGRRPGGLCGGVGGACGETDGHDAGDGRGDEFLRTFRPPFRMRFPPLAGIGDSVVSDGE